MVFIRYCTHDKQILNAKKYGKVKNILEFNIDKSNYEEDELDNEINNMNEKLSLEPSSSEIEGILKLNIIEKELVVDDEYISLSIDYNEKSEMKYLSKEQFKWINNTNNPSIIWGCAGSGKSMVAIRKLLLNNSLNIKTVYITTSKFMIDQIESLYNKFSNEKNNSIKFYTLKDICKDIIGGKDKLIINYYDFCKWINEYACLEENTILNYREIWIEIMSIIRTKGTIISKNEYLQDNESNFMLKYKKIIYKIAIQYNSWLKNNDYYDMNDLIYFALQNVNEYEKFDYIIYDEIQEASNLQIEMLFKLVKNINNVMFLGDLNQRININNFDINNMKKYIFKNNSNLIQEYTNKNYRNNSCLVEWINNFIKIKNKNINKHKKRPTEEVLCVRKGHKPKLVYKVKDERSLFNILDNDNTSIIIVNEEVDKSIIKNKGYPIGRVFTIEEVRGLEYDNVYCYNLIYNFRNIWEKVLNSDIQNKKMYEIYFNMIYIAATRSKKNIIFLEKDKTILQEKLSSYWEEVIEESIFSNVTNKDDNIGRWIKEAKKLEKAEKYYQAAEAYKKAGMFDEARICTKAMERKISYENIEKNTSYINIRSNFITKEIILKCLKELKTKYKAKLYGYLNIMFYYKDNEGRKIKKYL